MKKIVTLLFALPVLSIAAELRPVRLIDAVADTERPGAPATLVIDGRTDDASRWLSAKRTGGHWLEVTLAGPVRLGGLHVFSGYEGRDAPADFTVRFWRDGDWRDIPSAMVTGNTRTALALSFDENAEVTTDRLRLVITRTPGGVARVAEVVAWPYDPAGVPAIGAGDTLAGLPTIFLNQSGFDEDAPKRFTLPGSADKEVPFVIRAAEGGDALFQGVARSGVGDFTAFEPHDDRDYVVEADGHRSAPFRIGPWWLERVTYQGAVDFMIDSRHYVGSDREKRVWSYAWRDAHHFGWELNTLVPQWLSNPSAYERMPRQIQYEAPADPSLWGRLEPPKPDAPDIVKLIHWGADVIVTQGTTHEMLKAQLAYFLYAWPMLRDYLPEQNYTVVRDFAFAHWADASADRDDYRHDESPEHDLLALKTKVGTTKGAYPPGFSIEPNLMMHEVALREGRADAGVYLQAALRQADWIVRELDWNDPLTTKGQRVGEFLTMTGLAHLLAVYPGQAPAGLRAKINDWADVVIRRSGNLWDFRKLGDEPDQWTPTGPKPSMWNEVGNVVGLPAAILAALPYVDDPAKADRLDQILWAHFDAMFGRNPVGRHFGYKASDEIEGVERGWFSQYIGGNGKLEHARFVLDGCPKNAHYPFNPSIGNVGWTEGWVQHNTPFNLSLAYLAKARSALSAKLDGDRLDVTLVAPLNFDYDRRESGTVVVTASSGDRRLLVVEEQGNSAAAFVGHLKIAQDGAVAADDGRVTLAPGDSVTVSYGFGYYGRTVTLRR